MELFCTLSNQRDGFGAQYQRIIEYYIVVVCKYGINSIHYTPITYLEHNYDNSNKFIDKIENLINIKKNVHMVETNIKYKQIDLGIILSEFEQNIDYYCQSDPMNFIKKCFWENKTKKLVFNNDKINIAVHIRRGNIHDRGQAGARITTPNEYYLNIMNGIRNKYKEHDKELQFHIYSQGEMNNFAILQKDDVIFHLDEDICKTFIELVGADILVTSPSSLSYVAALISDGEIYFKQFWHKPKSDWIVCK